MKSIGAWLMEHLWLRSIDVTPTQELPPTETVPVSVGQAREDTDEVRRRLRILEARVGIIRHAERWRHHAP